MCTTPQQGVIETTNNDRIGAVNSDTFAAGSKTKSSATQRADFELCQSIHIAIVTPVLRMAMTINQWLLRIDAGRNAASTLPYKSKAGYGQILVLPRRHTRTAVQSLKSQPV